MRTTKVMVKWLDYEDPAGDANIRVSVPLPNGWRRVWSGALKPGDCYLNAQLIDAGIVQWIEAPTPTEEQVRHRDPYTSADYFLCLIREGEPVDAACERCEVNAAWRCRRFCLHCCEIVLKQQRKDGGSCVV